MTGPEEFVAAAVDRPTPEDVAAFLAVVDGPVLPEADVPGFDPPSEVETFGELDYDLPDAFPYLEGDGR
jgi:hypothetical protein